MNKKPTYTNFTIRIKEEDLQALKEQAKEKGKSPNKLASEIIQQSNLKNGRNSFNELALAEHKKFLTNLQAEFDMKPMNLSLVEIEELIYE